MAAAFDAFIETLREPSQPTLCPTRLADALQLDTSGLAEITGVHRSTVTEKPHSVELQSAMRDIVKVLAAAFRVNSDRDRTLFWLINHPIADFEYKTPAELVKNGRSDSVLKYLATLEAGATA
jgi:hypothetical protein